MKSEKRPNTGGPSPRYDLICPCGAKAATGRMVPAHEGTGTRTRLLYHTNG